MCRQFYINKDPWHEIRLGGYLDAFNTRMAEVITPGIPHQTKIARKPEGVGAELKSVRVACGESLVILRLEAMEGKDANCAKQWTEEFGEGTAIVLRLCQPWAGSGRIVIADSAFSSVKTLIPAFTWN